MDFYFSPPPENLNHSILPSVKSYTSPKAYTLQKTYFRLNKVQTSSRDFLKPFYSKTQEKLYLDFIKNQKLKLYFTQKIEDSYFLSLKIFKTKKDAEEYHIKSKPYLETHKKKLQLKKEEYKYITKKQLSFYFIFSREVLKKPRDNNFI